MPKPKYPAGSFPKEQVFQFGVVCDASKQQVVGDNDNREWCLIQASLTNTDKLNIYLGDLDAVTAVLEAGDVFLIDKTMPFYGRVRVYDATITDGCLVTEVSKWAA